jgi:competence ComEA-like helix-hairpin-helix protein
VSWFSASFLLASGTLAATKKPPLQPINLNAATSEELQSAPGIGPATAEKILLMRKSYGAFKSVDDLLAIRGIGKKRLDKMRKLLIVGRPAVASKPSPGKAAAVGRPANSDGRGKLLPPSARDASLPVKSILKSTPSSEKPADTPAIPETDEEPQRR